MQTFLSPPTGDTGKFQGVANAFPDVWHGRLLDVGSRSGRLQTVLGDRIESYTSLDITPPADIVGSIEDGLDVADRAFDVVVALDVLEHTNDIHAAFRELARLADDYLIISLPNMLEIKGRLRYLRGRHISSKYGIPIEPVADRHRWFFSFNDARRFLSEYGRQQGWRVRSEGALIGPGRDRLRPLVERYPNLLSQTYLVALERVA